MLKNSSHRYGLITRCLHWLIALAVISQIIIAIVMENSTGFFVRELYSIHKSLGLSLLLLSILFIVWRFFNKRPKLPDAIPTWQRYVANFVQFCLYCLLLIMSLSGWFMSTAAGYAPSFWGWFKVAAPVARSKTIASFCGDVHSICAWILGVLIVVHILAVCKHVLIDKDGLLKQML